MLKKTEGRWRIIQGTGNITLVGVAFHDFKHTANGTSPNCLELHPVLKVVIDNHG